MSHVQQGATPAFLRAVAVYCGQMASIEHEDCLCGVYRREAMGLAVLERGGESEAR